MSLCIVQDEVIVTSLFDVEQRANDSRRGGPTGRVGSGIIRRACGLRPQRREKGVRDTTQLLASEDALVAWHPELSDTSAEVKSQKTKEKKFGQQLQWARDSD